MTVQYRHWRLFTRVGGIVALPAVLFLFLQLDIGPYTKALRMVSFAFVALLGCCGVAAAVLQRAGVLIFHFTERDRRRPDYRVARLVAEMERSHGCSFSHHYYESFGLPPAKERAADDEGD